MENITVTTTSTLTSGEIRKQRLMIKRNLSALRSNIKSKLKTIIAVYDSVIEFDEKVLANKLTSAKLSNYGYIAGLLNVIEGIEQFPANIGEGAQAEQNRLEIHKKLEQKELKIETDLLDQLKDSKGNNTFISKQGQIIEGKEPDLETYYDYVYLILESLNLIPEELEKEILEDQNLLERMVTTEEWNKNEIIEKDKAEKKFKTIQELLDSSEDEFDKMANVI